MDILIKRGDKYSVILDVICEAKGIDRKELFKLIKDRECKYLLFLLLKKYKCDNLQKLNKDFCIDSKKSVSYNLKKAEEKFFVNKEFRDMYFEVEKILEKTIK